MNMRSLAAVVASVAIAASLSACSSAPSQSDGAPSTGDTQTEKVTTLSSSTLPTAVGTTWSTVRSDGADVPVDFNISGPWTLSAGDDWGEAVSEIVDPASVPGIGEFEEVTFVVKTAAANGPATYYPRRVTDEWVQGLGRIIVDGENVTPEPGEVSNYWPLDLEVGKEYEVADTDEFKTVATVLSRNTATVPAGTIENAYLVRYRSTLATDGKALDFYYLMAADAGMVAWLSDLTGSEEAGFTAAKTIMLLGTMPAIGN